MRRRNARGDRVPAPLPVHDRSGAALLPPPARPRRSSWRSAAYRLRTRPSASAACSGTPAGPAPPGKIPPPFSEALHERFDLVGFDPRGVGESTPLRCFATLEEGFELLAPPFPITPEQERDVIGRATQGHATRARATAGRSCRTWRPATSRVTSISSARPSATAACHTSASRTAPTSARSTRTCSRAACAPSCSTRCSTPSSGRPARRRRSATSRWNSGSARSSAPTRRC